MKKTHALIDYTHYNDNDLIAEGRKVVLMSTGNPHAAGVTPAVDKVKEDTDAFDTANTAAAGGDHVLVIEKGKARIKLEETLHDFAEEIDKVADGDEEIIVGCGLNASSQPTPSLHEDLELERSGVPKQIIAKCMKLEGAGAYVWQYFYGLNPPTDESLWDWKTVTLQIEATLSNFNQGDLCVRYCAVTKDGMQPWSQHRHIFVI
jgi:hypothetical protein